MVIEEKRIMGGQEIKALMQKLLADILAKNRQVTNLALVGIKTGGEYIANWLHKEITSITGKEVLKGMIDITLYRDDILTRKKQPTVRSTDIPFNINKKTIILVDDVLYTGRTTRAALDALLDMGRPRVVQLAVLVDRGHRELPIAADFVGKVLETKKDEMLDITFEGSEDNWGVRLRYGVR
jgi:pyrimidine operon attenuation protein / uracil phosphoribosyltransferase